MRCLNLYSMRSAVKHHPVYLWGYQTFTNLPSGVVFKDANELLPYADFTHAMTIGATKFIEKDRPDERGRNVAQLSDLIRALALHAYGGWWLDADTIVLRPLPSAEPYFFATVAQKRSGGGYMDAAAKVAKNSHELSRNSQELPGAARS